MRICRLVLHALDAYSDVMSDYSLELAYLVGNKMFMETQAWNTGDSGG
jgi:hypothetical protein